MSSGTIFITAVRIRGVHAFPKGISPKVKVNVFALVGTELAYYDVAVQHVNHYLLS